MNGDHRQGGQIESPASVSARVTPNNSRPKPRPLKLGRKPPIKGIGIELILSSPLALQK
jgi:hypothetical protein